MAITEPCIDTAPVKVVVAVAVQALALERLSPKVPVVVIGPPVRVESVATLVTVPEPPVPAIQVPSMAKQPSEISNPPAKVEVAFVSVIAKEPENVLVAVEVAVKYEALTESSNEPCPATESFQLGEVVPMPMLPRK